MLNVLFRVTDLIEAKGIDKKRIGKISSGLIFPGCNYS
jgi:hypothetical protein